MSKKKTRRLKVRRMRRVLGRTLEPLAGLRMAIHRTDYGCGIGRRHLHGSEHAN